MAAASAFAGMLRAGLFEDALHGLRSFSERGDSDAGAVGREKHVGPSQGRQSGMTCME